MRRGRRRGHRAARATWKTRAARAARNPCLASTQAQGTQAHPHQRAVRGQRRRARTWVAAPCRARGCTRPGLDLLRCPHQPRAASVASSTAAGTGGPRWARRPQACTRPDPGPRWATRRAVRRCQIQTLAPWTAPRPCARRRRGLDPARSQAAHARRGETAATGRSRCATRPCGARRWSRGAPRPGGPQDPARGRREGSAALAAQFQ